jgi:hypothetical protein
MASPMQRPIEPSGMAPAAPAQLGGRTRCVTRLEDAVQKMGWLRMAN